MPPVSVCARLRVSLLAVSAFAFGACSGAEQLTNASHDTPDIPVAEPLAGVRPLASATLASATAVSPSASSFRGGIPFGTSAQPTEAFGDGLNGGLRNIYPGQLLKELAGIKAQGGRVALMFAGNEENYKDGNGHFSLSMWKDRIDRFKGVNFTSYIADGTIIGHYMIDEPNDPFNWHGEPIPGSTLEEMAAYSKQLWPTMVTIARTRPDYLDNWPVTYRYLDAAWAQYAQRFGDPAKFIEDNAAKAKKLGLGLISGLNMTKGTLTKGELTGDQLKSWASAILDNPYSCAFISWRYEERYLKRPEIKAVMESLAEKARIHPSSSCRAGQETPPPPPPVGTTTTITGHGPDPSAQGASIAVRFTVTASVGTPSGSVQVTEANGATCSGTVALGSCTLTPVGSGARNITATYPGASGFNRSSDTKAHTVNTPPPVNATTTTITGDGLDPSVPGAAITVTFSVTSPGGTPAGTVQVTDDNGGSCSATVLSGSCTLTPGGTGTRNLTATYQGTASFSPSSDTEPHTVSTLPPGNRPPTAAFALPRCTVGVICQFTDGSSDDGTIAKWKWVFGDGVGSGSIRKDPPHTYRTVSTFPVTLTVTDDKGVTGSVTQDLTVAPVNTPPPVNATTTTITGDGLDPSVPGAAITVTFSVTSPGGTPAGTVQVTDDNGGSCSATVLSGSCTLTPGGTGTRNLTATYQGTASFSPSSDTEPHTVSALPPGNRPPTAAFALPRCTVGVICQFTDGSSDDGTIAKWKWVFGDGVGSGSIRKDPPHTYRTVSTFPVTLTVTDDKGVTGSVTQNLTVLPVNTPPTAAFTPPSCTVGVPCQFNDGSRDNDGDIAGWSWDLGDGTTLDAKDPSHTYAAANTYTVALTVTDNRGATNGVSQSVTVSLPPNKLPTAAFTPPKCIAGVPCEFKDGSSDSDGSIATRSWSFGAGATSTDTDPSNTFANPGSYSVTLAVTDNRGGTNSVTQNVTVSPPNAPPTAAFTAPAKCTVGLACKFKDGSGDKDGSIANRGWAFGDGKTSTDTDPSNIYAIAGSYSVTLTVTDNGGATSSVSHSVTVAPATLPGSTPIVLKVKDLVKAQKGQYMRISWTGAGGSAVDVYRDGVLRGNTVNDGLARVGLPPKLAATYTFKVCEKGTSKCSNTATARM